MSKSLGNYVGVTDPPEEMFGRLMSIPDEAMAEYYRLLLGEEQPRAPPERGQARAGAAARRPLPRRGGGGARPRRHFDRVFVEHGAPEEIAELGLDPYAGGDGEVHLPRLIAGAFGLSSSEARRLLEPGRGQARRRDAARRSRSMSPPASSTARSCRSASGASPLRPTWPTARRLTAQRYIPPSSSGLPRWPRASKGGDTRSQRRSGL